MIETGAGGFAIEQAGILAGTAHGFFGSAGGLHQFGFGGPGDAAAIAGLRAKAARALGGEFELAAPHQTHSADVLVVEAPWQDTAEGRPQGDGVVTAQPGIALGIVTADCGPVLLADSEAGVIGAAHAGWRGAHGGVLENTIAAMQRLGAKRERIAAALGPTISQKSYEVDRAFTEQIGEHGEAFLAPAPPRDGMERWFFDLPGYILYRLRKAGIEKVEDLGRDTFSHAARYHSYRRSAQKEEGTYGRQIAMIAL